MQTKLLSLSGRLGIPISPVRKTGREWVFSYFTPYSPLSSSNRALTFLHTSQNLMLLCSKPTSQHGHWSMFSALTQISTISILLSLVFSPTEQLRGLRGEDAEVGVGRFRTRSWGHLMAEVVYVLYYYY